ncbi:MAG TPA: multidrug transporter subunit MdtD [Steroidobacteraceae bacterium]
MYTERHLRILQWLIAVGFFMQTLDSTIVNTALPAMAGSLGELPLRMQSVVISYALTMAMLIPASGWVADRFGIRRAYLVAIVLFVTGSVLCAGSRTLVELNASRVVQGAGGAMLLPVGRLAILRAFPNERLLAAMSFIAIPGLLGPLIGPTLGGWLVDVASWHWIFLINVPIGVAGCAATFAFMPEYRESNVARFDVMGYVLLSLGMVAVSFAIDGLSELSLRHATVLLLLIFGLATLAAYWLRAPQHAHSLFPPSLFRNATFSIGLIGNLFSRLGSSGMPFLLPLFLQVSLGYSPFHSGLLMLPTSVGAILSKRLVTPVVERVGYRRTLVVNTWLVGFAMASFALISEKEPMWLLVVQFGLFGIVNSLQFTAMNTVTLKDLRGAAASSGNSLLSMVQMLAMSLGTAAAGGLLTAFVDVFGHATRHELPAFHATFVCVGLMTVAAAWIFWQLTADLPSARPGVEEPEIAATKPTEST